PALFLDRDGTINLDTGYPDDPAAMALRDGIAPVIAAANERGIPVVVVTNQSGIARGYFGWDAFARVNGRVLDLLAEQNAFVDMVLACAYHEAGTGLLAMVDHPMRKPNPGMLLEAGRQLGLDLKGSLIVGLTRGWLVDGEGSMMGGLSVLPLRDATDLGGLLTAVRSL
ncbi:MAG: HAD-IIIA family hydrolase, partial [Mesorhizobium sp.]